MKKHIIYLGFLLLITFVNGQEKDSIFFKYKDDYILQHQDLLNSPNTWYLKDSHPFGPFLMERIDTLYDLNPSKVLNMEKYLKTTEFYRKNALRKLLDEDLCRYLDENYEVFIVVKDQRKKYFIKILPFTEMY